MKSTNWWLVGALGVGAYLLFKKSGAGSSAAMIPAAGAPTGASPGLIQQTAYETFDPNNAKTQCEMAGKYWYLDQCLDPMTSSFACTHLGGTWAGGTCTFPDTTGM